MRLYVHCACTHTHTHTHTLSLSLSFHLCPSLALSLFNSLSLPLPLYLSFLPLSPPSLCPPSLSSPPPPFSFTPSVHVCNRTLLSPSFLLHRVFDNPCRYAPFLCHYRNGHLTVVQYLLEKCSAGVNLKDNEGGIPLHDACR